jgi:hypothetical protein
MSEQITSRVHYFKGQFLRTADFADEQAYHLAMRRRHNIAHHQWGIVAGLELVLDEAGLPYVKPGMAVDGYGRELIVIAGRPLPINQFDLEESDTLDVWLIYSESGGQPAPAGYTSCEPDSANSFYRWQEMPQLWLEKPQEEPANRHQPPLVDPEEFNFAPQLPPPNADKIWPVFLGQVTRDLSQTPTTYTVTGNDRPYVGAVAHTIIAPSDQTKIQLGADGKDETIRLKVASAQDDPYLTLTVTPPDTDGQMQKAWTLAGKTAVADTLTIDKGSLQFEAGGACSPQAMPWSMYRCDDNGVEALRLELPEDSGGQNRLVFGTWSADDEAFQPILTLADNGQITVHGNLFVQGKVSEIPAPGFSAAAVQQINAVFAGSLGRAHLALPGLNIPGSQIGLLAGTPQALVQNLEDSAFLNQFATILNDNPELLSPLLAALDLDVGGGSS